MPPPKRWSGCSRSGRTSSQSSSPSSLPHAPVARVEPQALAIREPLLGDLAQDRAQPEVDVERGGGRHREHALGPVEVGRADRRLQVVLERIGERRALGERVRPADCQNAGQDRHPADGEHEDVELERPLPRLEHEREDERDRRQPGAEQEPHHEPLHAASSPSLYSSSARRPTSASIASSFIPAWISCELNFARE